MSSQSDNRLSPEELKRRNGLPPDTLEPQAETVSVAHPTAEEWQAGAAGGAVECGRVVGDADRTPGGVGPTSDHPAVLGADAGYGTGAGCDPNAAGAGSAETGTGWEEERAALFAPLAQRSAGALQAGVAAPATGIGALAGAAVDVGAALERTQRPVYVTRPHSDKKALRREREKKIAAGHKPDDHEDYTMAQTL